jgi:DNA-binding NarL/FixJ family response regulator
LLAAAGGNGSEPREAPDLSQRELEVLRLIAEGVRSPAIARELGISVGTVEVHRRNIMRKLGLHTVAELTRYAIREGLIAP